MRLLLIRHAIAEELTDIKKDDSARELTAEGTSKMELAACGLALIVSELEFLISSPYKRAVQTADIINKHLKVKSRLEDAAFTPSADVQDALQSVAKIAQSGAIAIVSHEPFLSTFLAYLLNLPYGSISPFKKGSVASVHCHALRAPTNGSLEWYLTPRVLREMAS